MNYGIIIQYSYAIDMMTEIVKEALSSENEELMLLSFLLARQCAVEGTTLRCLTYPAWFKKTFGNKNSTLATSQSSCRFLIKFLTHLVPYEPAACLKAHADQVNIKLIREQLNKTKCKLYLLNIFLL
jgi:hypothetical protein